MEGSLPQDLRITSANPVFSNTAAQDYQNRYFDNAIQPQLNQAKVNAFLGGNYGDANSTFGSTYLSNAMLQGSNQAFFAGQDYRNQEIQNTLNRRASFFGNDANLIAQQNQADVQRGLGVQQINSQNLGMLNSFNLNKAGILSGIQQNDYQNKLQAAQAKAQAIGGLLTGGLGLIGGGIGAATGGGARAAGGATASTMPLNFTIPSFSYGPNLTSARSQWGSW